MGFRTLYAYQKGFEQAMMIFSISKSFPKVENYALTDQVRRSSRSVCSNIAEGYRKRLYPAHFLSKITDSEMENSETFVWIEFAFACEYISPHEYEELTELNAEVGKLLNHMRNNPQKYS